MLSGTHDISAEQNATYSISFQYFDKDDVAIDINPTFVKVRFIVRKSSLLQDKNLFEILFSFLNPEGIYNDVDEGFLSYPNSDAEYGEITIDENNITVTISSDTMSSVTPGSYFYYLNVENIDEEKFCLVKGRFVVEAP